MEELEFIQNERLKLQEKYLKEAKNIWIEFDSEEADKKHKKLYNEYRNKDYFLEGLQAKLEVYESLINGLEEDNKFKTEYEAKAEELKQLLNEMGC